MLAITSVAALTLGGMATANEPPQLHLALSSAQEGSPLVVTATATDPDGDALRVSYAWAVDGQPSPHRSASLPETDFVRGDLVRVRVTATDRLTSVQRVATARIGAAAALDRPAFAAIHLEPIDEGSLDTRSTAYPARYWPALVEMVDLAESFDHRLTLMFSPQWIEYAGADATRVQQLQRWRLRGHELAAHHHGVTAPEWDGFTGIDHPEVMAEPSYRGDLGDMMDTLEMLGMSMRSYNGSFDGLPPDVHNIAIGENDRTVCFPEDVLELDGETYRLFGFRTVEEEAEVITLETEVETCDAGSILGVSWHGVHYADSPDLVERVFAALAADGVRLRGMDELP